MDDRYSRELDLRVFEALSPLNPMWMEHEQKWFVMVPNEWEAEVERFDTEAEARTFVAKVRFDIGA